MARRRPIGKFAALILGLIVPLVGGTAALGVVSDAAAVDDPILLAAGDIAGCDSTGDEETASILDAEQGTIACWGPASGSASSEAALSDDPVLLAAGDITRCTSSGDEQTAAILDSEPGTVAASGLFGAASKIAAVT